MRQFLEAFPSVVEDAYFAAASVKSGRVLLSRHRWPNPEPAYAADVNSVLEDLMEAGIGGTTLRSPQMGALVEVTIFYFPFEVPPKGF